MKTFSSSKMYVLLNTTNDEHETRIINLDSNMSKRMALAN